MLLLVQRVQRASASGSSSSSEKEVRVRIQIKKDEEGTEMDDPHDMSHLFEIPVLPGEERNAAVAGEAHQVRRPRRRHHFNFNCM